MSTVAPDSRFPEHLAEMARRADAALGRGAYDALALAAGSPPLHYRDDQYYPHKAAAHVLAWAPLPDAPASLVVHRPGRRPTLLFYQPEDYWHAPPSMPEERWLDSYEVVRLKQPAEAQLHLGIAQFQAGQFDEARKTLDNVGGSPGITALAHAWSLVAQSQQPQAPAATASAAK